MDLNELLKGIKPNIITPHMEEIMRANPAARANVIARHILRGMVKQKGKTNPIDIIHNGEIKTVRFLDPEPLCEGPWAAYSLMLLNASYGEQATIIEALYPDKKQVMAKAFAATFSHDTLPEIQRKNEDEILTAVENANAGIAMILSKMDHSGNGIHADEVAKQRTAMQKLADSVMERERYRKKFEKSQQHFKKEDEK